MPTINLTIEGEIETEDDVRTLVDDLKSVLWFTISALPYKYRIEIAEHIIEETRKDMSGPPAPDPRQLKLIKGNGNDRE